MLSQPLFHHMEDILLYYEMHKKIRFVKLDDEILQRNTTKPTAKEVVS